MKIQKIRRLSTISRLKSHPLYSSAKAGCMDSANSIAADLIPRITLRPSIICPVIKASGNRIPLAMAVKLAEQNTLCAYTTQVLLSNPKSHPAMAGRIYSNPEFSGKVHAANYTLVDDVYTTGKTLITLKQYIEDKGGNVIDIICLGSSKATGFELSKLDIKRLKGKFPEINLYYDIMNFTKPMARYVMRFNSLQAFHTRTNEILYSNLYHGAPHA